MRGIVAIVGRPNVGKSTLFNRLIQKKKAIVDAQDGVTRDRVYGTVQWEGAEFLLIDTGGIMIHPKDTIDEAIRLQAQLAIDEADVILFMVDVMTGATEFDLEIARILRKSQKNVLIVSNKSDNDARSIASNEFYSLGFGTPHSISALNGIGTGDLLDLLMPLLPGSARKMMNNYDLKIALLGMPNAGKSTIANTYLGEERHIVTEIPGTTRDSVDSEFRYQNKNVLLVDTAGLRKRTRVKDAVEFYSTVRTHKAIAESDVCILIVDAEKGFVKQDIRIAEMIIDKRKGLILAVNKWDLIEKDDKTAKEFTNKLVYQFPPLEHYPIFYISAVKKQRLLKVLDEAFAINNRLNQRVSTAELNNFFQEIFKTTPPPAVDGKYIRPKYVTQVSDNPPIFILFTNEPKLIPDSYKRFVERELRKRFDYLGVPLNIFFKAK